MASHNKWLDFRLHLNLELQYVCMYVCVYIKLTFVSATLLWIWIWCECTWSKYSATQLQSIKCLLKRIYVQVCVCFICRDRRRGAGFCCKFSLLVGRHIFLYIRLLKSKKIVYTQRIFFFLKKTFLCLSESLRIYVELVIDADHVHMYMYHMYIHNC
jgi:hypothetical protein